MDSRIKTAIGLREEGKTEEAKNLLLEVLKERPDDALANYQCAWAHDRLGLETQAVPYYVSAIKHGLEGADLEGAFLGLGSTYRTIGEYEKSFETLERGSRAFPQNRALQIFMSMSLYNLGRHAEAMEILLRNIIETSSDPAIKQYERAISYYKDKLDETWK
jgi:tetratricopeptide (TPR) repeat protein